MVVLLDYDRVFCSLEYVIFSVFSLSALSRSISLCLSSIALVMHFKRLRRNYVFINHFFVGIYDNILHFFVINPCYSVFLLLYFYRERV